MSAVRSAPAARSAPITRIGPALTMRHTAILTRRNVIRIFRTPQLLLFSTIQPIMLVLLFTFVFGGAIPLPDINYIDYLLPGVIIQTSAFGSTNTSVGLTEDLQAGIVDRFRSLPMARSAVLAGRTLADAVRNSIAILLMLAVGHIIGFRFGAGAAAALAMMVLALVCGLCFSWMSAWVGLKTRTPEVAQAASIIVVFPFIFASSAYVPVGSMPGWLRLFAENQPITRFVDGLRALSLGGPTARPLLLALLWVVIILGVFIPISVRAYRRSAE